MEPGATVGAEKKAHRGVGFFRQLLSGNPQNLAEGSLLRAVVALGVPLIITMAFDAINSVAELGLAARLGSGAMAVVGLNEALLTVATVAGGGLAAAALAIVSRRIGEQRPEAAGAAAVQLLGFAGVVGLALGGGMAFFAADLLHLVGASASGIEQGKSFSRAMLGSCGILLCQFVLYGVFQAAGTASLSIRAQAMGFGLTMLLYPVLIFGVGPVRGLGLFGVALASITGRIVTLALLLRTFVAGRAKASPRGWWSHVNASDTLSLLRTAAGGAAQQVAPVMGGLLLIRMVAQFGDVVIASWTVGERLEVTLILPAWALAQTASAIVGQSLGAGNPARAQAVTWRLALAAMATLTCIAAAYFWQPTAFLGLFVRDAEVLSCSMRFLRVAMPAMLPFGAAMVLASALNGAGDTLSPAILNVVSMGPLQLALAYGLSRTSLKEMAFPIALGVAQATSAVGIGIIFLSGRWKTKRI